MVDQVVIARPKRAADTFEKMASGAWVVGFILFQFAMQLLLIAPGFGSVRVGLRVAGFAASLILLAFLPLRGRMPPLVKPWAMGIFVILGLEFFNPEGAAFVPAIAQFMLNLAIVAPIFWVSRAAVTVRTFHQLVISFWIFYSLSAALGVLQAYFPGRFEPALSTVVADHGRAQVMSLQIQLASGEHIFRPMGLTDTPGGAAYGALYAVVLGAGVLLLPKRPFSGARLIAMGGMLVGMMCLYLCQVRALLVMAGICVVGMIAVMMASGRASRAIGLLAAAGALIPASFLLALSLGGRSVTDRLSTLVESDAGSVYYVHRGIFLEQTINEYLPRYPLGAGLGHWGMACRYFGTMVESLYVEIQWTGWVFDGGLPLVLTYCGAILTATWLCLKVAQGHVARNEPSLGVWAAVVVAYNIGALALCFNYPVFIGTAGLEFWLLNAALVCAARNSELVLRSGVHKNSE